MNKVEGFLRRVSVLDVTMGHTLLCVLGVFLLNILLYCGCAQDSLLIIEPIWSTLFTRESVTLICDMREGEDTDWYYTFWKDGQVFIQYSTHKNYTLQPLATGHSGEYQCLGLLKSSTSFRKESNKVSLTVSDKDVILESAASTLYEGESVTLRCRHRTQTEEKNATFYKDGSLIEMDTNHQSPIISTNTAEMTTELLSDGSSYMCKFDEDEESEPIKLKVEPHRPKAELRADRRDIPAGGSVTLTCSVKPSSSGWKYFWYRGEKTSEPLTAQDADLLSDGQIRVSQGGLYWCRGGRGDPVYYTEYSHSITINTIIPNRAIVTLQPNWPQIFSGETFTVRCEIEGGGYTKWTYEWTPAKLNTPPTYSEYRISRATESHSGDYRCKGRRDSYSSTEWSDVITVTVSDKPQPVLTVSPSWLSPADSVTLNCSVKDPSAGWRFYWYKAVPKLADNSYSDELLPGNSSGTEQDSYIVHGQTHTAGYKCRAGRGAPVYYTQYSEPKFVWSGDFHSSASLTVSPDRVQHFLSDSVSLNCEGNSAEWRVRRFTEDGYPSYCSYWGTMTGSTCSIGRYRQSAAVYWCESGSGEFSNAVNITKQNKDIILVSPVRPVTEGDSVSLSCKLGTEKLVSDVFFYRNGELIQNDTRRELNISAVSKSDEGFYKCQHSGKTSPQSWMSVKAVSRPESSSFPVPLIVGLVCGTVLILLLLLLYHCRQSKDSCFIRPIQSDSTNRGSATNHVVNQNEAERNEYSTPLDDADESQDVTYSLIELKNIGKKGKQHEPEESSVYSDVKMGTADDNLMYAQICHNKGKAKKNKGKSTPAAADEPVYSEVKAGTALGNNAAI